MIVLIKVKRSENIITISPGKENENAIEILSSQKVIFRLLTESVPFGQAHKRPYFGQEGFEPIEDSFTLTGYTDTMRTLNRKLRQTIPKRLRQSVGKLLDTKDTSDIYAELLMKKEVQGIRQELEGAITNRIRNRKCPKDTRQFYRDEDAAGGDGCRCYSSSLGHYQFYRTEFDQNT